MINPTNHIPFLNYISQFPQSQTLTLHHIRISHYSFTYILHNDTIHLLYSTNHFRTLSNPYTYYLHTITSLNDISTLI